jgi:hypothetical protein
MKKCDKISLLSILAVILVGIFLALFKDVIISKLGSLTGFYVGVGDIVLLYLAFGFFLMGFVRKVCREN